jgi:hypothetical protein
VLEEGDMPYRQPWDMGSAHAAALRQQADVERALRAARGYRPRTFRLVAAGVARTAAQIFGRLADALEARSPHAITAGGRPTVSLPTVGRSRSAARPERVEVPTRGA